MAWRERANFESLLVGNKTPHILDICAPPHLYLEMSAAGLQAVQHVGREKRRVPSLVDCDEVARIEAETIGRQVPIFQYQLGNSLYTLRRLFERGPTRCAYLSAIETAWPRSDACFAVKTRED